MGINSILLIEDDTNLRNSFTLILQRAGYFVTPTDCIYKVMNLIHYGNYQLVISDLNMPEVKRNLLPTLISSYPHLPLVILTDQPSSDLEKGDHLRSAFYLVKPVAPERLLDCIELVVGRRDYHL